MYVYRNMYLPHSASDFAKEMGADWRPAYLVSEHSFEDLQEALIKGGHVVMESRMFDAATGQPVGDTHNYCIDPNCDADFCAPLQMVGIFP